MQTETKIVIVGAGPAGLAAARRLVEAGLRPIVLEESAHPGGQGTRRLSPLTSRYSASPLLGRWARMRNLLVTPEERAVPAIITEAQAMMRRLPRSAPGADSILRLGRQPDLMERHVAMLPPLPAKRDLSDRLPAITAEAKIAHAGTRAEALALLDRDETDALISDAAILQRWSRLPE